MMRRDARGFTLLEVVIAFALLAAVLAVVLRLFSEGASGTARAERRTIAVLHAESKLAEILATTTEPGQWRGKFADGYLWTAALLPRDERRLGDLAPTLEAFQVTVTVRAPGEDAARAVGLDTLHLVPVKVETQ
jgi:general secretion pathway protein I